MCTGRRRDDQQAEEAEQEQDRHGAVDGDRRVQRAGGEEADDAAGRRACRRRRRAGVGMPGGDVGQAAGGEGRARSRPTPMRRLAAVVLGCAQQPHAQERAGRAARRTRPGRRCRRRPRGRRRRRRPRQAPPLAGGDDDGQGDEGEADAVAAVLGLEVAGEVPTRRTAPPATWAMPIQVPRTARSGSGSPPPLACVLVAARAAAVVPACGTRTSRRARRQGARTRPRPADRSVTEEEVVTGRHASQATRRRTPAPRAHTQRDRRRCAVRPPCTSHMAKKSRAPADDGWTGRGPLSSVPGHECQRKPRLAGQQPSSAVGCSG